MKAVTLSYQCSLFCVSFAFFVNNVQTFDDAGKSSGEKAVHAQKFKFQYGSIK
jgi:hypothetical protein